MARPAVPTGSSACHIFMVTGCQSSTQLHTKLGSVVSGVMAAQSVGMPKSRAAVIGLGRALGQGFRARA